MEIEWEEIKRDIEQENQIEEEQINKHIKQKIMAKYQLMQKTENNGEVWYYILKENGMSVNNSWTMKLENAEKMFEEIQKGKPTEPIIKILKTIEVNEDETN
jgi:hypothetical protein